MANWTLEDLDVGGAPAPATSSVAAPTSAPTPRTGRWTLEDLDVQEAPAQETVSVKPPEKKLSDSVMGDVIKTGASIAGGIGGFFTPIPGGAALGATAGGALAEAGLQWYGGEEFDPLDIVYEGALGGASQVVGGGLVKGAVGVGKLAAGAGRAVAPTLVKAAAPAAKFALDAQKNVWAKAAMDLLAAGMGASSGGGAAGAAGAVIINQTMRRIGREGLKAIVRAAEDPAKRAAMQQLSLQFAKNQGPGAIAKAATMTSEQFLATLSNIAGHALEPDPEDQLVQPYVPARPYAKLKAGGRYY